MNPSRECGTANALNIQPKEGNRVFKTLGRVFLLAFHIILFCVPNAGTCATDGAANVSLEETMEALIRQLGHPKSIVRQEAVRRIRLHGEQAVPFLKAELKNPDGEIRLRAKDLLDDIVPDPKTEAIKNLTEMGIEIASRGNGEVYSINASNQKLRDTDVAKIALFDSVENIYLERTRITNDGLRNLQDLRSVRTLILASTRINDDGMEIVASFPRLQMLSLARTRVTDEGLSHLENSHALERLYLGGSRVNGSGLGALKALPRLRWLSFQGSNVDDQLLDHVVELPNLQVLTLDHTQISDKSITKLTKLKRLSQVSVTNTQVSDAAIEDLGKIKTLRTLNLHGSKVTQAGYARLKKLLPKCRISGINLSKKP